MAYDAGPGRGRQRITKRGLFSRDLPAMMFGFGDPDPQRDVVNLMEEIVVEHITDVLSSAHRVSTNRGKLKIDDIVFALSTSSSRTHPPSAPPSDRPSTAPSTGSPRYAPYPKARRKVSLAEKQLSRIEELLFMQEDLARARGRADDLAAYGEDGRGDEDGQPPGPTVGQGGGSGARLGEGGGKGKRKA